MVDPAITARSFAGLVMDCVLNSDLWVEMEFEEHQCGQMVDNNIPIFVRGLLKSMLLHGESRRKAA